MNTFKERPVNKTSLLRRKPILGVGINDAEYITFYHEDGKNRTCPYYNRWKLILARCYSKKIQESNPSYINCTMCDEWLVFSNFRAWMVRQEWEGKQIDKDLLVQGNKIYSPSTCIFVDQSINCLITDSKSARGKYPIGVCFNKAANMFVAQCNDGKGNRIHIGCFVSVKAAYDAYKIYKYRVISKIAKKQTEPLRTALMNYKIEEYSTLVNDAWSTQ